MKGSPETDPVPESDQLAGNGPSPKPTVQSSPVYPAGRGSKLLMAGVMSLNWAYLTWSPFVKKTMRRSGLLYHSIFH